MPDDEHGDDQEHDHRDDDEPVEPSGELRRLAHAENAIKDDGRIAATWLRDKATNDTGVIGRRARVALKLRGLK